MSRYRLLFIAVVLPVTLSIPLRADEPKTKADSPEAVAKRAMEALKEDRLDDFAKAMHPDALKELKSVMVSVVEAAEKGGQAKDLLALLGNAKSSDDLNKLDEQKFFVVFYRGLTRSQPKLKEVLSGAEIKVLGHIMEGTDTAHVIHRMTMTVEGTKVAKMEVISMRKTESGWGMMLTGDLENVAKALRRQFGAEKK
jgi:hypothetical protein